ncbi:MAG: hypothetical protein HY471_00210 [Candidatus Sungbacteria bacterium]|nr:hypothetical protein [Candidatus Sungbacteria bacterium]
MEMRLSKQPILIVLLGGLIFVFSILIQSSQKLVSLFSPKASNIQSRGVVPGLCPAQNAEVKNPRPSLFIGCGIVE